MRFNAMWSAVRLVEVREGHLGDFGDDGCLGWEEKGIGYI